jgi:hypothetical protein
MCCHYGSFFFVQATDTRIHNNDLCLETIHNNYSLLLKNANMNMYLHALTEKNSEKSANLHVAIVKKPS